MFKQDYKGIGSRLPLAEALKESGIMLSEEAKALFVQLFETIREASQFALRALVGGDERAAQSFVASRDAVWKLSTEHMAISVLPRGVLAGELSV